MAGLCELIFLPYPTRMDSGTVGGVGTVGGGGVWRGTVRF
jgi:hypothetical protein